MLTGKLKCAEKRHGRQGIYILISLCELGWLQYITVINAWFEVDTLAIVNLTQNYIRINSGNKKQM